MPNTLNKVPLKNGVSRYKKFNEFDMTCKMFNDRPVLSCSVKEKTWWATVPWTITPSSRILIIPFSEQWHMIELFQKWLYILQGGRAAINEVTLLTGFNTIIYRGIRSVWHHAILLLLLFWNASSASEHRNIWKSNLFLTTEVRNGFVS